ncbi:MAG: 3-deoxy-D-manno-octulosonic acid transferase [Hyphomonadaceae bacterium]
MSAHPPALSLYRGATRVLGPALSTWLSLRAQAGKEDRARLRERYGEASAARPDGRLVWLHGASVGELGVVLQVQSELAARDPALSFLITTGTRTSAEVFARRAPDAIHQYAPMDRLDAVRSFLAHWRPDLGVFVESEIWPNLAIEAQAAGVPLALVNARVSEKTLSGWRRAKQSAARVLAAFDPILASDARTAEGLSALTGRNVPLVGNLKLAAAPPRVDEHALASLKAEIAERPVWLAASTHIGEEDILAGVHERLRMRHANALLILALRHPERGQDVSNALGRAPRRSKGQRIGDSRIYIVDTIGELGLFYAAAPVSLVAGSLQPGLRGHNPIEPARLGSAILFGPFVDSFADLYEALAQADGAWRVERPEDVEAAVMHFWADEKGRRALVEAARRVADQGAPALQATIDALMARLPAPSETQRAHASA